jgi:hypothetical protein
MASPTVRRKAIESLMKKPLESVSIPNMPEFLVIAHYRITNLQISFHAHGGG